MENNMKTTTNQPLIHHGNLLREKSKLIPDLINYSVIVNVPQGNLKLAKEFDNNKVSTSKYTYFNCIPKILIEQFSKMANVYFLIIAIMQMITEISISQGKPVILLPLSVVVIINGIKDFIEDLRRKKSDDEENTRKTMIYNKEKGEFEKKTWQDVKVGNILKIFDGEYFPADLVLMNSSESNGICYVETKNLDGETNLKYKKANFKIAEKSKNDTDLRIFQGRIDTKCPNEFIYEFDGKFAFSCDIDDNNNLQLLQQSTCASVNQVGYLLTNMERMIFLDKDTFLLRGCSLRQTESIYAFVVYAGHQTKIMKNSPNARQKNSRIESIMNYQIIVIFLLQTALSIIGAIFYITWLHSSANELEYIFPLGISDNSQLSVLFFFYRMGTWTLIFTNLVPISLLVTLEMVKFIQGMFISWDIHMYDTERRTVTKVQTSTLNEELGQVKFIFSDKTGTLTRNYMEFKKISVGNFSYGQDDMKEEALLNLSDEKGKITNFNFVDSTFENHLHNPAHENHTNIKLFLTCLATCHTVITDPKENRKIIYQSSSPDESALVNCARYFKYTFSGRDIHNNIYVDIDNNSTITFELLNILEYSSERKRMSVILKCPDGKIRMFIKGADSVISDRVTVNPEMIPVTSHHLFQFAQSGLRTLMVAYKDIPSDVYHAWADEYRAALIQQANEKEKVEAEFFDKIENSLHLLGATAIEDKLQDNVDQVLSSFIETGIKVWVLTGDKVDTAKSIAYSSKLITHEFILFEIPEKASSLEIKEKLNEYLLQIVDTSIADLSSSSADNIIPKEKKYALIVSSNELIRIFNKKELTDSFYSLAIRCNSVLCCRVTPKQKAQMVNLIKERQPKITTLAIGDGANDVNMITSANIGIGILGVEGRQAARASDYAISQFQYLKRLLFVHGRESYRKNSFVVCYNFYKNILFVVPQFWFGFVSYFSGQPLYDPWIYQLYNIFFTSLPIIWFGIYDKEVSYDTLMTDSRYYTQGIVGKLFHSLRFWKWILYGMLQAIFIYLFSYLSNFGPINPTGGLQDLWSCGSIAYSGIVLIVNVKILLATSTHSVISFALCFASVLSYYIILQIMSCIPKFENFNNFAMNFSSGIFYLSTILLVMICMLLDIGVANIFRLFGWIADPLKLRPVEFEPKILLEEVEQIKHEIIGEVNNKFLGSAFSQEPGQTPHIVPRSVES